MDDAGLTPHDAAPDRAGVRDTDWAATPLGPMESWPPLLRSTAALCFNAVAPLAIYWGPDFLLLYNDAWGAFLADRHPAVLGQPARLVWPEIWPFISAQFAQIVASRQGISLARQRLELRRFGRLCETFWDYSLNPIIDQDGTVAGVLNFSAESTEIVAAERRRQDSEAYLRLVLDNSVNALYGVAPDGITTFCNDVFLRMLGFAHARDAIGRSLHELIHHTHPDGTPYDKRLCPVYLGAQTGQPAHVEDEFFYRLDGTAFPVEYWVKPIVRDGVLQGSICSFIDITARKQAELALRESEERFRLIADSAPVPMWVTRLDRKRAFVNHAYMDFLGLTYEESLAYDWRNSLHPDDAARIYQEQAVKEGSLRPFTLEARYRNRHGEWRWLRSESQPRWGPDGRHEGFIGVAYDVTAERQAAIELEAANVTLEARVEARTRERDRAWKQSQDLQVVVNPQGTFLAANEAWRTVLGYAPEEVVGRNHLGFAHPSFHRANADALSHALHADLPSYETLMRHKDGGMRWISWVAAPGQGVIYASGRNVTAEKEAASALAAAQEQLRQSQKMEAVGQLTGGIAHDFNNLLTGLTGSLEVLETRLAQGRLDGVERYFAAAQGAVQRAAALTHRLLAFSRRQTLDPKVTDINSLVAGMADLISRTVGPAIATSFKPAPDLWPVLVDPNQLESSLLNLCINARDAMPNGGRLSVSTVNVSLDQRHARSHDLPAGDYVSLHVSDTGEGMAPEVIERAFDPFFTTKPIGQGTGLGLSMVYGFARQSGGQARIASVPGQGTTMCVFLPRHDGEVDMPSPVPSAPSGRSGGRGEIVLVVDDEPTIRMLAREALEEMGYTALEAEDGRAALAVLEGDGRIDLLVTDLGLPGGINGRQVAERGRAARPGLKVLMITGYAETALLGEGRMAAGMELLPKPFTMDALEGRVRALIGKG
jgi:PAS domain S-box-containing protein